MQSATYVNAWIGRHIKRELVVVSTVDDISTKALIPTFNAASVQLPDCKINVFLVAVLDHPRASSLKHLFRDLNTNNLSKISCSSVQFILCHVARQVIKPHKFPGKGWIRLHSTRFVLVPAGSTLTFARS